MGNKSSKGIVHNVNYNSYNNNNNNSNGLIADFGPGSPANYIPNNKAIKSKPFLADFQPIDDGAFSKYRSLTELSEMIMFVLSTLATVKLRHIMFI